MIFPGEIAFIITTIHANIQPGLPMIKATNDGHLSAHQFHLQFFPITIFKKQRRNAILVEFITVQKPDYLFARHDMRTDQVLEIRHVSGIKLTKIVWESLVILS